MRALSWTGRVAVLALCVASAVAGRWELYKTLGIRKNATQREIKSAYRDLAKKYHPDKSSEDDAADKFNKITNAYNVLNDEEKRVIYDEEQESIFGGTSNFENAEANHDQRTNSRDFREYFKTSQNSDGSHKFTFTFGERRPERTYTFTLSEDFLESIPALITAFVIGLQVTLLLVPCCCCLCLLRCCCRVCRRRGRVPKDGVGAEAEGDADKEKEKKKAA